MAKVIVFTPDLLFGSGLIGALVASGHKAVMCSTPEAIEAEANGAEVLIVDLTDDAAGRSQAVRHLVASGPLDGVPTLGYFSHVEPESRDQALEAGIDRAVPRSRMHREPAALVESLLSDR